MKNLFIFSVLLFAFSCKKEKTNTPEAVVAIEETPPGLPSQIVLGASSPSITIVDFDPDVQLSVTQNSVSYTIGDNFKLTGGYFWACAGGMVDRYCKIETLNNSSFILTDSIYTITEVYPNIPAAQVNVHELYPKILSANDVISLSSKWSNGTFKIAYSNGQAVQCGGDGHFVTMQNWLGQYDKYIGVLCNGKLGWIKINVSTNSTATILEYASVHN